METMENKMIRPRRVACNLCNVFRKWSQGHDEEVVSCFVNFIPCNYLGVFFLKRQASQTYLYSRVSLIFGHQIFYYAYECVQNDELHVHQK